MHRSTPLWALAAALLLAPAAHAGGPTIDCATVPQLMARLHEGHVSGLKPDAPFADRVANLFLRQLDSQKTMYRADEADRIANRVRGFVQNRGGEGCGLLDALVADQNTRVAALEKVVAEMVDAPDFQVDQALVLDTDTDKRPWPKNAVEQQALRRKLVHVQVAQMIASGDTLEQARAKMKKRYALLGKRTQEQRAGDYYTSFLSAYASALDPHTSYFSHDDLVDFQISMQLSLEGIGASLRQKDGYTVVQEVIKGGAADRQGQLKRKDKIIAVAQGKDGEPVDVVDMSLRDVVRLIRGKKGTEVKLSVLRQGTKTRTLSIVITRDKIDLKEQAASLHWHELKRGDKTLKLARLVLPSFYGGRDSKRQSDDDMRALLAEARDKGADGLLLDLSRNSGGLLSAAVDIAGLFIREGGVVAVRGNENKVLDDDDPRVQWQGPMVVLTSRISASASEIVAGALKDYDRALLVGDSRSFGKGTVQTMDPLPPPQGALKVTVARFYRPSGQSTQAQGVPVDIVIPSLTDRDIFAESEQPYALPTDTTRPFVSDEANTPGAEGWKPFPKARIPALAAASKARVAANKALQEALEKRAKFEKNGDVIKVAEILADGKGEEDEDKEDEDDDKASPQALEALEILADALAG
ncbi:MAG: PDZ domain-containing protein [Myxococcales bacterium]|nr:PDZ domain-containing protein [Myxococcales bacterium]